jgi:hypothetical protein
MLSLNGRCVEVPVNYAAALLALRVVHRDAALRALDEHDERRHRADHQDEDQRERRVDFAVADELERAADRRRQARDDAREDDHRDAVAEAALRDLLAEPHQEHGARDHRDGGHEQELRARVDHDALVLERDGRAGALERRKGDRAVARVLRELAAARLAFLAQRLQARHDHAHHLHDDRRGDVGHDAHGEDRQPLQRAAREHVEHAQDGALLVLEEPRERHRVDARHRDERADAVNHQRADEEQEPAPQLGEPAGFPERGKRTR